ncbi:MAG: hypothetical protein U5L11_00405 [Arhodomonas sp.]|nr:hypothetical protein [Arhodomonas sp.]
MVLNFENADLREVVRYILGDLLEVNYNLERGVDGTRHHGHQPPAAGIGRHPGARGDPPAQMGLAALVRDGGLYRAAIAAWTGPCPEARPARRCGASDPGLNARIAPLEYIAASEMNEILEPFLSPGSLVHVDDKRDLPDPGRHAPGARHRGSTPSIILRPWTGSRGCRWACPPWTRPTPADPGRRARGHHRRRRGGAAGRHVPR